MAFLRSPAGNNFDRLEKPGKDVNYPHPAASRKGLIPLAFQITSPFDSRQALLPHALVLHMNPSNFAEQHTKKVERTQTRGGWVEQHWGDDLSEISCSGSTGAFVNFYTGTSSVVRQQTIAWDKYRDLYDLYRNNGSIYDPFGNIVLQGKLMLMFDRGTYIGTFRDFEIEETVDSPFVFNLSWKFKVEETITLIPDATPYSPGTPGLRRGGKTAPPDGYLEFQYSQVKIK